MKPMTADELKAAFAALPPMDPVDSEHSWRFWAWDLRQNVANGDPSEFLRWPTINISMFVGNAPYIDYEIDSLPLGKCREYLEEPGIGKPALYDRYLQDTRSTSGNLIHQMYHFVQWAKNAERWLPELETVVEIGGGYGAMALICHRLGFRGRYIIYDLPEFSLLQQYYLSNVGIEGVEFKTQIDKPIDCDLLIGLYSLSEMSISNRTRIISYCPTRSYLIAYGAAWGGYDNVVWASELMRDKSYNWHNWNIPHLPNCWYLVGDKRNG